MCWFWSAPRDVLVEGDVFRPTRYYVLILFLLKWDFILIFTIFLTNKKFTIQKSAEIIEDFKNKW